jgi:AraC-like DNA-binding protein
MPLRTPAGTLREMQKGHVNVFMSFPEASDPPGDVHKSWEELAVISGFRASTLAELCNVSLRTLERHFRKRYQTTVSVWLRDLRLAEAYQTIRSGEPIKTAAYNLSFKHPSHFSRAFKKAHGVPSHLIPAQSPPLFKRLLLRDLSVVLTARDFVCEDAEKSGSRFKIKRGKSIGARPAAKRLDAGASLGPERI